MSALILMLVALTLNVLICRDHSNAFVLKDFMVKEIYTVKVSIIFNSIILQSTYD